MKKETKNRIVIYSIAFLFILLEIYVLMPRLGGKVHLSKEGLTFHILDTYVFNMSLESTNEKKKYPKNQEEFEKLVISWYGKACKDGYGNPYRYIYLAGKDYETFFVYSCGVNGKDEKGLGDDLFTEANYKLLPYNWQIKLKNRYEEIKSILGYTPDDSEKRQKNQKPK